MVEQQQYITSNLSSHQDLSGPHQSADNERSLAALPLPTSTYPDITPFSAVSPFNLSHQCDSSLLTPVSTIGSPPLNESRKPLRQQYPPPPGTPYSQAPTPPASSRMYHQWSNHFDMNGQASQAASPMNNAAPVPPVYYVNERRTPGPPEHYLGNYGVSETHETQPMHHQGPSYYMGGHLDNHNMVMRNEDHGPMGRGAVQPPHLPSQSPIYHNPGRDAGFACRSPAQVSPDGRRRVAQGRGGLRDGVRKQAHKSVRLKSTRNNAQLDPADDHKNCYGHEIPPTLKSTCPEEERCIFEARWRHRNQRGQDMWDSIQADFLKKFNKQHGKEMLQMKFKRGRAKYLQWEERDNQLLVEAFRKLEDNRYQLILNYFLEMGGSRNMLLSASDIEIKLVNDLKLEDNVYIQAGEGLDVRRRRKVSTKKRPGGRGEPVTDGLARDDTINAMSHPSLAEDDVINQVYERRERWDEAAPPINGEMMDIPMWDSRAPMKNESGAMISPQNGHCAKTYPHTNGGPHAGNHVVGAPAHQPLYHRRK